MVGLVFLVQLLFGKCDIPKCSGGDITTLCALEEALDEPPKPWPVKIDLVITFGDLIHVNEEKNFIKVLFNIGQYWNDTRITAGSDKTFYQLKSNVLDEVWYDEPFFFNTVKVEKFQRIISDTSSYL